MTNEETTAIQEVALKEVTLVVGDEIEFVNQPGKRFLIANHQDSGGYFTCIPIIEGLYYTHLGGGSTHPISDAFKVIGHWNLEQVVKGIEDFFRDTLHFSQTEPLPSKFVEELNWQREYYRPILGTKRVVSQSY